MTMVRTVRCGVFAACLLLVSAPAISRAQSPDDAADAAAASVADQEGEGAGLFEGGDHPDLLDETLSVEGDLAADERDRALFHRGQTMLGPWFAWKQGLREQTGLNIGGSWGLLWQNYSVSRIDERNAVGSKLTLNLSYDFTDRGQPNALTFDMAIEDRRPVGTELAPLQAGLAAGSALPTAATWGEFDLGITQAYIRQNLEDNRFQYAIGKLFAPNFVNAYPFFDDNRQFLNVSFATSPTIPIPLRGFGVVAAGFPTDGNLYLKSGVFTTRSDDTGWTVSDFFFVDEHFYFVEVGWSGLAGMGAPIQGRGPTDRNNLHMTFWYRDELEDGSPEAHGVAFNANFMAGERAMWFVRGGWSDNWLADLNLTAGFGWRPANAPSDLFGAGVGWTRPANDLLDPQWTVETFYRFHITQNFAITPDLQWAIDPALSPDEDSIFIFSLRSRVTF
jgi:carbohydrate-selective porin OprB